MTKGLFSSKSVEVSGFPFLNGEIKEISLASLTIKNLCQRHNSLLSKYDSEAIKYSDAIQFGYELSLKRRASKAKKFNIYRRTIDLDNFNRWVIKTYLGLLQFFSHPSVFPEKDLALRVFSHSHIKRHINYVVDMSNDEEFRVGEVVTIQPLLENGYIKGLIFSIRGIRLMARILDDPLENTEALRIKWVENINRPSFEIVFK